MKVSWERRCQECGSGSVHFTFERNAEFCRWCGAEVDIANLRREAFAAAGVEPPTSEELVAKVEELLDRDADKDARGGDA